MVCRRHTPLRCGRTGDAVQAASSRLWFWARGSAIDASSDYSRSQGGSGRRPSPGICGGPRRAARRRQHGRCRRRRSGGARGRAPACRRAWAAIVSRSCTMTANLSRDEWFGSFTSGFPANAEGASSWRVVRSAARPQALLALGKRCVAIRDDAMGGRARSGHYDGTRRRACIE